MAEREDISLGLVGLERVRPAKSYTVAAPPSNAKAGDMAYFSNGSQGSPCWAIYDGTNWKVVSASTTIAAS